MTKKPNNSSSHNKLVDNILLAFGSHPRITLRKRIVAVAKTERGATVRVGTPGECDIDGVVCRTIRAKGTTNPNGFQPLDWERDVQVAHYVAIEVKTGSAVLSKAQETYRDAIVKMGAIYIEARSVEDVYIGLTKALANTGERL